MKRSYPTFLGVCVASVALLVSAVLPSVAASFSGRVIDEAGQPVPNVIVGFSSFVGEMPPNRRHRSEPMFPPAQPSETDETGAFSITDIASPAVHTLVLMPEHEAEYEFQSIKIDGVTFHLDPQMHRWQRGGFPFTIEQGADVKDIEITVRLRMRIRGRVLSADGTPLNNAQVDFSLNRRRLKGGGGGSSGPTTLDPDGYFTKYVNAAAYYTVTVKYQGHSAESEEILLEDGQRLDGLVLTLRAEPQPSKPEKVEVAPHIQDRARFEAARKREREGVWAINPDNRHAYKMIRCNTREEAQARAVAQKAHLVAINDEAEQQWLLEVFGKRENFWIGLTVDTKETEQQWDNGEPITYTNWNSPKETAESTKSPQTEDMRQRYTVLVGLTEKWQLTRHGSPLARLTERALLEKENLIIGAPESDSDTEKR